MKGKATRSVKLKRLEASFTKRQLAEKFLDTLEPLNPSGLQWYGVAYYGWGTWEEDVFFTEQSSPVDAIKAFTTEVDNGNWSNHGSERDDRSFFGEEQLFVYEIGNGDTYKPVPVETEWRKQNG